MSEDGSGFQDVSEEDGAEASSPAAAPALAAGAVADRPVSPAASVESVDSVDAWVTDLLDRLAAGDKLNASDAARVPYATQLQLWETGRMRAMHQRLGSQGVSDRRHLH